MNSLKNLANIGKMIPLKYFPVFAQVRIQAPHVFARKLIHQEFFPACIGFVPGGTSIRGDNSPKRFCNNYRSRIEGGEGLSELVMEFPEVLRVSLKFGLELSGSNATPQLSGYTGVAFSPYVFAMSHENRARHLKVSQKRPCRTLLDGVSHLKSAIHTS